MIVLKQVQGTVCNHVLMAFAFNEQLKPARRLTGAGSVRRAKRGGQTLRAPAALSVAARCCAVGRGRRQLRC